MEPNFYENLILEKDKDNKELILKMSKLLDESLDSLILLRQNQAKEKKNIEIKPSKNIFFKISEEPQIISNDFSDIFSFRSRQERLERIRRIEEDTENLERLIENDNIETIG